MAVAGPLVAGTARSGKAGIDIDDSTTNEEHEAMTHLYKSDATRAESFEEIAEEMDISIEEAEERFEDCEAVHVWPCGCHIEESKDHNGSPEYCATVGSEGECADGLQAAADWLTRKWHKRECCRNEEPKKFRVGMTRSILWAFDMVVEAEDAAEAKAIVERMGDGDGDGIEGWEPLHPFDFTVDTVEKVSA